jgi:hypothetical protein
MVPEITKETTDAIKKPIPSENVDDELKKIYDEMKTRVA